METKLCLNSCSSSRGDEEQEPKPNANNIRRTYHSAEEGAVDSELWDAFLGKKVNIPAINSIVYYFPEGHAEHAQYPLDNLLQTMNNAPPPPPHVLCRVVSRNLMADPESDEVFVKIGLDPMKQNPESDRSMEEEIMKDGFSIKEDAVEKPVTFTKTLTPSDADNSSSFTVPKQCAVAIFPKLNYEEKTPVQFICCKDVHGNTWSFRHVFRGSPKRHLLNGGWGKFVDSKKLVAGDTIVFLKKGSTGEIHVGIKRSMKEGEKLKSRNRIRKEGLIESIRKACEGEAFEVEYYPRAAGSTPEYWVKASLVREATMIPWCPGMRFKMAVESEDQSRINWFMGTVVLVKNQWWKKSLWRQLEVTWDKAATGRQLEDVKRVNPWMVEPVSTILPTLPDPLHLSPPPAKKICLPPYDFLSNSACPPLNFSTGHLFQVPLRQQFPRCFLGIQGSRHNDHHSLVFHYKDDDAGKDDVACVLTIGQNALAPEASAPPAAAAANSSTTTSTAPFRLFGKTYMIFKAGPEF